MLPTKLSLKKILLICFLLVVVGGGLLPSLTITAADAVQTTVRPDGLTIIQHPLPASGAETAEPVQHLTLILKTGYGHDPDGKAGLTKLTNEMVYLLLAYETPAGVSLQTLGSYSVFNFSVPDKHYKIFCTILADIISADALLLYDLCNELVLYHKNEPHYPGDQAQIKLYESVYGPIHPYTMGLKPNYQNLNIAEANSWFRNIYRPNNMIIATSKELPEDFLLRPVGRDLKEPVKLRQVAPASCSNIPSLFFIPVHDNIATITLAFPAPRFDSDRLFTALLLEEYLQTELLEQIREQGAYCYYLQVNYSWSNQAAAPIIEVNFQTLPEDAGPALAKVINILNQTGKNGILESRIAHLIELKKNRRLMRDKEPARLIQAAALQNLFSQDWVTNSDSYLTGLNQAAKADPAAWLLKSLPYLKIAVAGPASTNDSLKAVLPLVNSLAKP